MRPLFILILTTFYFLSFSQVVNIPDQNFKNYLLGDPLINLNGDGEIQVSEASIYDGEIYLYQLNVSSLVGIEAFPLLTMFDIVDTNSLVIDLSANLNLTYVSVSSAAVDTLDFSANCMLEDVRISSTSYNKLDFCPNGSLKSLYLSSNRLDSLLLINLPSLEDLTCNDHYLRYSELSNLPNLNNIKITSFSCDSVVLNSLPELRRLQLYTDSLQNVVLNSVDSVSWFDLTSNIRTNLPWSNFKNVQRFNLGFTPIHEIFPDSLPALREIRVLNGSFKELDLSSLPGLRSFWVSNNDSLTYLNVANGYSTSFTYYRCDNCPNLYCVQVDEPYLAELVWNNVDDYVSYSLDCRNFHASKDEFNFEDITAYPNPANDLVYIENTLGSEAKIQLVNGLGEIVISSIINRVNTSLVVGDLPRGFYYVIITTDTRQTTSKIILH